MQGIRSKNNKPMQRVSKSKSQNAELPLKNAFSFHAAKPIKCNAFPSDLFSKVEAITSP